MLKLIRIDDRLVHGQVALTWTPALNINCMVVANDRAATDEFLRMTLGLAKPAGVRLHILTLKDAVDFLHDEKNGGLSILVLVNSVKDVCMLAEGVAAVQSINFGGIRARPGASAVSKAVALTPDDIVLVRELLGRGIELEVRQVPTDKKVDLQTLLS
ncbi:MAG: PTS sugar transporter subunit IIB [Bacteroidetes bacterium]|nr:PTS sugar transporter subunit IIB [Bacteroidota bacterium]